MIASTHGDREAGKDMTSAPDPVRAVLFDFGGVLAEEGFREGLTAIAQAQGIEPDKIPELGMECVYESGYVIGQGSESDLWQLMRDRSNITGEDAELSEMILSGFVVRPWMLELVQRLRTQGYVTGILSDQTEWIEHLDARYHFLSLFDHVFVSFRLGKGKRDPSLFGDVLGELGLRPREVLFVDDDPGNVSRARSQGIQAVVYVDRDSLGRELAELLPRST